MKGILIWAKLIRFTTGETHNRTDTLECAASGLTSKPDQNEGSYELHMNACQIRSGVNWECPRNELKELASLSDRSAGLCGFSLGNLSVLLVAIISRPLIWSLINQKSAVVNAIILISYDFLMISRHNTLLFIIFLVFNYHLKGTLKGYLRTT